MRRILPAIASLAITAKSWAAEQKIDIFPPSLYDQSTVYLNLLLFWLGIIGAVVVLVLKLREAERVQNMDSPSRQKDIPSLD
jgi:hypothetical protein